MRPTLTRALPLLPLVLLLAGTAACTSSGGGGTTPSPSSSVATSSSAPPSSPASSAPSSITVSAPASDGRTLTGSPIRAGEVKVYADCTAPTARPSEIVLTCADGGIRITGITWSQWGDTQATGAGTLRYNDCNPNCAQGKIHAVANTAVTLTDPVTSADGTPLWSKITEQPAPPGFSGTQSLPLRPS